MPLRICVIGAGYVGKALGVDWKQRGAHATFTTTTRERVPELQQIADRVWLLGSEGLKPWHKELAACDAVMVTVAPKNHSLAAYHACYLETLQQLLGCIANTRTPPHLFYTSSTSVYGERHGAETTETDTSAQLDPYASVLYQAEQLLLRAMAERSDLRVTILRLGEIIGPQRAFVQRLREANQKPFAGDGSRLVNVSHLPAIIQAMAFCYQNALIGLYNLCSSQHPTRAQLYREISLREGLPQPVWDQTLPISHPGNKCVVSEKIARAGFCYPEEPLQ